MILYERHRANPSGGIYHQWDRNLCFRPHLHDSFELICVYEGSVDVAVNEKWFTVQAGQAILIIPNQIHEARHTESSKTYLCIFQSSLVEEFYQLVKNTEADSPVFDIQDPLFVDKITAPDISRYQLKSYLYDIIHQFDTACGKYSSRTGRSMELVGQILVFISAHYSENINMQSVANELGYDYRYLSNLLQKHLHITFRSILNEYRISRAKQLLTAGNDTIAHIAYKCGYESIKSFNRNFKKLTGLTPSEYRNHSH